MNQKGPANITLALIVVVLLGIGGYLSFANKSEPVSKQETPVATRDTGLTETVTQNKNKTSTPEKPITQQKKIEKDSPPLFSYLEDNSLESVSTTLDLQAITKKFYQTHQDQYDVLIFATNFLVGKKIGDINNQAILVKNDVKGIGKIIFDNSAEYGSKGKLREVVLINNEIDYATPNFFNLSLLIHEIGHIWVMFLGSPELAINRDGAHWSNFVDAGIRIGNKIYPNVNNGGIWKDNGNGTFTELNMPDYVFDPNTFSFRYNSLDLYLMGFIPSSETTPVALIIPDTSKENIYPDYTGTKQWISVEDLMGIGSMQQNSPKKSGVSRPVSSHDGYFSEAYGKREPEYPNTQREFSVGLILVNKPGAKPTSQQVNTMNWVAESLPQAWNLATSGFSSIEIK
jgi:hypothetical protein